MWERLKKRLHRHKWHEYTRKTQGGCGGVIFCCRECRCGADQLSDKWGAHWVDISTYKWRFDWEKEWFDNAVKQQKV